MMNKLQQHAERRITKTMEELNEAIKARDPVRICELSRALLWKAHYAYSYPELWTAERVQTALQLLRVAAQATVGTSKQEKCAWRPEAFELEIERMRDARRTLDSAWNIARAV